MYIISLFEFSLWHDLSKIHHKISNLHFVALFFGHESHFVAIERSFCSNNAVPTEIIHDIATKWLAQLHFSFTKGDYIHKSYGIYTYIYTCTYYISMDIYIYICTYMYICAHMCIHILPSVVRGVIMEAYGNPL